MRERLAGEDGRHLACLLAALREWGHDEDELAFTEDLWRLARAGGDTREQAEAYATAWLSTPPREGVKS